VAILKDEVRRESGRLIFQDGSTGLRVSHALNELGDFFRPRFDLGCRIIANEFVEVEELMSVVSGTSEVSLLLPLPHPSRRYHIQCWP
jgi:hypothetical protein